MGIVGWLVEDEGGDGFQFYPGLYGLPEHLEYLKGTDAVKLVCLIEMKE